MPHSVVKTEWDEHLWEEAKRIVQRQYGLTEADGEAYWRLVMGIFKRMHGKKAKQRLLRELVKELTQTLIELKTLIKHNLNCSARSSSS